MNQLSLKTHPRAPWDVLNRLLICGHEIPARSSGRKLNAERGPLAELGGHIELAAVLGYDLAADRKPQTCALATGLRGVERLHDTGLM